ncbi:Carboxyl transferase-family protein [Candidatus Protochlamydia naegleriophila]|uniref:Carboxyl transferase-family protein n=1 Tax=Candidatus Protochlamydia naegleriophila TaxID=389348 RepID=A0A0U5JET0_9BACT|nr:carboxyl transferase domain-containing protein [Candidatus Protochlamydia naegleriophila]CUI16879.1 Carboxyl transferase-family protein [Candidatus Protochlamydia naegleriophila]
MNLKAKQCEIKKESSKKHFIEYLSENHIIYKWLELNKEEHKQIINLKSNKFINIEGDLFKEFICLKKDQSYLILFLREVTLSFQDKQPISTLYELTINKKKSPSLKLYRQHHDNRLLLIHSTDLSKSILNNSDQSVCFFKDSYAEIQVDIHVFESEIFIDIKDKKAKKLLNFSSISFLKHPFKKLNYHLKLYISSKVSENSKISLLIQNEIERLLDEINLLPLQVKKKAADNLKKSPSEIAALYYFYKSAPNLRENSQTFLNQMLETNSKNFIQSLDCIFNHEKKAQDNSLIWAYRIPELIERCATKFRSTYPLKVNRIEHKVSSSFVELDLDPKTIQTNSLTGLINHNKGELIPAKNEYGQLRSWGQNRVGVVVGIKIDDLNTGFPVKRLLIIGDLTHKGKGTISANECAYINAAIRYAHKENIPIDWFATSFGVEISQERGVENLDASASTARAIIRYAHSKGVIINIIVDSVSTGAQAYWNALAAILPDTRGILIMTSKSSMILTGYRALVAALQSHLHSLDIQQAAKKIYPDGLKCLGGYSNVFGPNGEAMCLASNIQEACEILLLHHYYSALRKGDKIATSRPINISKNSGTVNIDLISKEIQNIQKGAIVKRELLLEALQTPGSPPALVLWKDAVGYQKASCNESKTCRSGLMSQDPNTIVQEMLIGSQPTMVIFPPLGPLTPADSLLVAKAIYKANRRMPVLIIGNLSGFNSDPLSMENHQLSSGAQIARAIVEHEGPITIIILGRLIGGTFVVFSKQLNPTLKIMAVEKSHIQVVGAQVAVKVLFHKRILNKAKQDDRLTNFIQRQEEINNIQNQTIQNHTYEKSHHYQVTSNAAQNISPMSKEYEANLRKIIEEIEFQERQAYEDYHDTERALKVNAIDIECAPNNLYDAFVQMQEKSLKEFIESSQTFEE